jgi:phosphoribosylformylglycinamidine cyclo-ligase
MITYQKSGVSIEKGNEFVRRIKPLAQGTFVPGAVSKIGGFSGWFDPGVYKIKNPLLVATTDGVGTKLRLAHLQHNHETIGIDLVAMNVNDLIVVGARPLFFLDYYAMGHLDLTQSVSVLKGIVQGCKDAGCALLGGETAEMPGFYKGEDYDLAGFAVGLIDRNKVIDGKSVRAGDVVLGLASSGFHSNGFSLVRKVFSDKELRGKIGKELLAPTKIYVKPILDVLEKVRVKAMAHITGGGFYDNIPRVLPKGLTVCVQMGSWPVPKLFQEVEKRAELSTFEAYRTFNMGIGMALILSSKHVKETQKILKRHNVESWPIGFVIPGTQVQLEAKKSQVKVKQ